MKSTVEIIKEVMGKVVYVKNPKLAEFMFKLGVWSKATSLKKASDTLNMLAETGYLEKIGQRKAAFYRRKGASGIADPHALKITDQLLQILLEHPTAQIIREPALPFGRKPDAAVFIDEKQYQFFFLEVELQNSIDFIEGKIKDYQENQTSVKSWFVSTFGVDSRNFCFHILFITNKGIDERPGVLVRQNYA